MLRSHSRCFSAWGQTQSKDFRLQAVPATCDLRQSQGCEPGKVLSPDTYVCDLGRRWLGWLWLLQAMIAQPEGICRNYYVVIDKYDFMNTQVSTAKANPARKLQLLMDEGSADRCNKF